MIAIDFETNGLNWWENTFVVTHLGTYDNEGRVYVYTSTDEIVQALVAISHVYEKVLVYNAGFELPIIKNLVPNETYIWYKEHMIDVMRLRQYYGVDSEHESFGLKHASERFLKIEPYEAPLKQWCKDKGYKEVDFRKYLGEMPEDMVVKYVADDAIATLNLYNFFTKSYAHWGYDWASDHSQYLQLVELVSEATRYGVPVDREAVQLYGNELQAQIDSNNALFLEQNKEGIAHVENVLWKQEKDKRKTEKGKEKVLKPTFNTNSDAQLALLMLDYYKVKPQFLTPKGKPSFSADKIHQFEQCYPLAQNGKLALVQNACKRLFELSEYDGLYHPQLKLVGTITGRLSGNGGLNVQGLSRRDKDFMSTLVARPGYVYVSSDGGSMEPTITANYTLDPNYTYAVYEGIGKAPLWANDLLYIDDIYLMFLSAIPFGKTLLVKMWGETYNGLSFSEQWLKDAEVIKDLLKKERKLAKLTVLGLGYGMGWKKLLTNLNDKGYPTDEKLAKQLHKTYWELFRGLKNFSYHLSEKAKSSDNFVVNPFGYGATIDSPHKAFNFFIQSSVNPIINKYLFEWLEAFPDMRFITLIHDELIMEIKETDIEAVKQASKLAIYNVNQWLQVQHHWKLQLRAGFVVGSNFYEAK